MYEVWHKGKFLREFPSEWHARVFIDDRYSEVQGHQLWIDFAQEYWIYKRIMI